jgi:hypothetical protein
MVMDLNRQLYGKNNNLCMESYIVNYKLQLFSVDV